MRERGVAGAQCKDVPARQVAFDRDGERQRARHAACSLLSSVGPQGGRLRLLDVRRGLGGFDGRVEPGLLLFQDDLAPSL